MTRLVDVAFPASSVGSDKLPKTRQRLVNYFKAGEHVLSRPGITSLLTISGLARGSFVWNGEIYAVYGTTLYRVDIVALTATSIGTIAGTGLIDSAAGFNETAIVVRETTGKGYTLNTSETLAEITDTDFVASNSVTHINGRFVYIPFNGDPAFFSDVGAAATIQGTSFFDAEELPDKNKVAFNWKNILVIGGTDSFELFRDLGGTPVPYVRLNARIDFGYIGGLVQYGDSFAFIGREKDQDVGVYILGRGTAIKISNEYIDSILTTYTEEELSDAIGQRLKWKGYDILGFTLNRHAFGYMNGWFDLVGGEGLPWKAGFITHYKQKYYTSRASDFGRLDRIATEYGQPFNRFIEMGFYNENNKDFTASSLEIGVSQGYEVGTVGLSLSRNNVLYSEYYFGDLGSIGEYGKKLVWRYPGGLGYYEGYMGIRILTSKDVDFDKLTVNL